MNRKSEPWYLHAILTAVILGLIYLLIQVAIIEPNHIVKMEKYYKTESRLRMDNIRQAEILWNDRFGSFTDNLDTLVHFVANDTVIQKLMGEVDTVTGRSKNPFKPLTVGEFVPDSLYRTPKTFSPYILVCDTSVVADTIINRRGRITGIDTTVTIGTLYLLVDPDGYGRIGDTSSMALKNTADWE